VIDAKNGYSTNLSTRGFILCKVEANWYLYPGSKQTFWCVLNELYVDLEGPLRNIMMS
jgi:hypothetical protein